MAQQFELKYDDLPEYMISISATMIVKFNRTTSVNDKCFTVVSYTVISFVYQKTMILFILLHDSLPMRLWWKSEPMKVGRTIPLCRAHFSSTYEIHHISPWFLAVQPLTSPFEPLRREARPIASPWMPLYSAWPMQSSGWASASVRRTGNGSQKEMDLFQPYM